MTPSTVAHDTFIIERTYDSPIAQVFRAWADPLLKARWFAGAAEALGAGYELDFRVGGQEVNRGGPPGGPVYIYESHFHDIVPEQRIVYTYEMFADDNRLSVSVATVQFHDHDGTTQLVLTEQGVFLDGHDTVAQREEGTQTLLDLLGRHLDRWRIVRKLFVQLLVSVDGYFDGPNQELDWFVVDDEFLSYVDAMLGTIDGILLGRVTYEGFAAHWPNSTQAQAAPMNRLPKFVASTTLRDATWSNTTIIAGDVPNAVARLKQEPGKDLAIFGSSNLASSLAAHGLIDEYRFFVAPVFLGRGKRFLDGSPDRLGRTLQKTSVSRSGVVANYYTPKGAAA